MFEGIKVRTPIEILWGDAWSNEMRYFYPDDPSGDFGLKRISTLGYFCRETEDTLVIAWQKGREPNENRLQGVFIIPKNWIIDWWEIEE